MATSSITANFTCSEKKAANTFIDLLLSETTPAEWTAPAPFSASHSFASKRAVRGAVARIVRARQSKIHA